MNRRLIGGVFRLAWNVPAILVLCLCTATVYGQTQTPVGAATAERDARATTADGGTAQRNLLRKACSCSF
jgi:hypothetical protein